MDWPLRFGLFIAPFHHPQQNPTRSLRRDLELLSRADELGYDEAWIGEHYSTGHEIIAGGDLFIAAAAERTHRLRLGTGVLSLPFHHPLVVASRAVQLDHMTMGRFMLGVGPGSLPTDSRMMGLDHLKQREMMAESFEAIMALLTSDEPVTRKTDWFTLDDAELQLRPYTWPCFETAVAAVESPVGPQLAGRHGASLLSLAATSGPGFLAMPRMWQVLDDTAAQHDLPAPDRRRWRVCGMMHVAETREQALAEVAHGLRQYVDYNTRVTGKVVGDPADGVPPASETSIEALTAGVLERRSACIGDPSDAVEFVQRMIDNSDGGFGRFLIMTNDWANPDATFRSLELIAREVFPAFDGSSQKPLAAQEKAAASRTDGVRVGRLAVEQATERYERSTRPEQGQDPGPAH